MKKIIAFLLVLAVSIIMTACSSDKSNKETEADKDTEAETVETEAETEGETEETETDDSSDKQQKILDYIDRDVVNMAKLEADMVASYESVSGENYQSEEIMRAELVDRTLVYANELWKEALRIDISNEDPDIAEVHDIYLKYVEANIEAFNLILESIDEQEPAKAEQADTLFEEATNRGSEYGQALVRLAADYGIE